MARRTELAAGPEPSARRRPAVFRASRSTLQATRRREITESLCASIARDRLVKADLTLGRGSRVAVGAAIAVLECRAAPPSA